MNQTEQYAEDVTSLLLGQGLLTDDDAENMKRHLRGW